MKNRQKKIINMKNRQKKNYQQILDFKSEKKFFMKIFFITPPLYEKSPKKNYQQILDFKSEKNFLEKYLFQNITSL